METTLSPFSTLSSYLCDLPFLNLQCGLNKETHDGDYKHEEKRLASALRKLGGILVSSAHITPTLIQQNLLHLENITETEIATLFDQGDHQNVPKAYRLLWLIYRAGMIDSIALSLDQKAFVLLGDFLHSFIYPYTSVSLSLWDQLVLLSKCAHLLFVLFRINKSDCLPVQLYYDMQASVKNVYFCVAKTLDLDPSLPFYILQCGDDRLENCFATFCTMSHNRNMDLLQLSERSSVAQRVDSIYAQHPSWHRGSYRLSMTGEAGIDHTNPASWLGDVIVGTVDLKTVWLEGREQAVRSLKKAGTSFDFDSLGAGHPGKPIDLMCPFGEYVGLRESTIKSSSGEKNTTAHAEIVGEPAEPQTPEITLEALAESVLIPAELGEDPEARVGWVEVNSRPVHLGSALKHLVGKDWNKKSTDRLRRVRGYTRDPFAGESDEFNSLGNDLKLGSTALTFIRVDDYPAAAIVRVTAIITGGGQHVHGMDDSHLSDLSVTIRCQVLALKQDEGGNWMWDMSWVALQRPGPGKGTSKSTPQQDQVSLSLAIIETKGPFLKTLQPDLGENDNAIFWFFTDDALRRLVADLWQLVRVQQLHQLPERLECDGFPYRDQNGMWYVKLRE